MNVKTRVYITTYNYERNDNHSEQQLKDMYQISDKKYELVNYPDDANIILIVDVKENVLKNGIDIWLDNVSKHSLIRRFPEKSFSISDMALPIILHHGIYINGEKGLFNRSRVCTGGYALFYDFVFNPYMAQHNFSIDQNVSKKYLLTFIGRQSASVRHDIYQLIFERRDILIEDSTSFNFFAKENTEEKLSRQEYYYQKLLQSKFSLCPRGTGAASLRLFESMQLGVAPVILSDAWIYPRGPKWSDFSIIIKEKNVKDIERIVTSFESSYAEMGLLARKAYENYFSKEVYFNYIVDNCLYIKKTQKIPEAWYQKVNPIYVIFIKVKDRVRIRSRLKKLLNK